MFTDIVTFYFNPAYLSHFVLILLFFTISGAMMREDLKIQSHTANKPRDEEDGFFIL